MRRSVADLQVDRHGARFLYVYKGTPRSGTVPFVDLGLQHAALAGALDDAFKRVLALGVFTLGGELRQFEAEFAAYCGTEHCVGVGSGTAALSLALTAAGIGPGDEVIVPAHTFIASALGVLHAGAVPVFCDVDPATGLIDPHAADAAVGPRTAALLPVHLYGQVCAMEELAQLARRHGLLIIEDAAQAHGASFANERAGALGAASAFSFYPSKNLGALGDGGAICTDDPGLAERARQLRNLGQRSKGEHLLTGYNERLDELQAALLRAKLPHLDAWNERRRAHAALYRELLAEELRPLQERPGYVCNYHLFPVRTSARGSLRALLAQAGVQTGIHYAPLAPEQPPFQDLPRGEWPNASAWAAEELSLPMFAELATEQIELISAICNGALDGGADGDRIASVRAPAAPR